MNPGSDLTNRLIEFLDGSTQTHLDRIVSDGRSNALQAKARCEEPLDDMIMKIPRDPIPIFQNPKPLLISSGIAELQRDGRWAGKGLGHVQVRGRERRVRYESAGHDRTAWTSFSEQRKRHGLADRYIWPQVQVHVRMLINECHPYALAVLHGSPREAVIDRVSNSDELAFVGTGSNR